ncbi:MAG: sigma 54-interacting transcriptional regulator, partial [Candidatus Omnitrophica bacterium]|nr:sigma 54-interacting transcriptional regulator [Candidatus Omnitrophota bacterium]
MNKLKQRGKILIIDDEPEIGWIFSKILGEEGYEITCVQTGKSGLAKLTDNLPDLVFLDLKLPDKDGIHILEEIKKARPGTIVIMITAHETIHTAVAAMKRGAYDYIPKPIPNERLKIIVDKALETQFLSRQLESLSEASAPINKIIGQSEVMQEFFRLIQTVAAHDISVILRGESGTGKELAARAIHSLSIRKDNAFVAIDCATLPDTLVESELFGYEKGAFTGADTSKIGRF